MQVRKVLIGSVMMGAVASAGLGLAGTASADYHKPSVTYSYQTSKKTVVVKDNQQVGNGNTQQTASGNAGAISNPQLGIGVNVGLQVPVSLNVAAQKGVGNQDPSLTQKAGTNSSYNSTSVNTSAENGNHSSVSIGSH